MIIENVKEVKRKCWGSIEKSVVRELRMFWDCAKKVGIKKVMGKCQKRAEKFLRDCKGGVPTRITKSKMKLGKWVSQKKTSREATPLKSI